MSEIQNINQRLDLMNDRLLKLYEAVGKLNELIDEIEKRTDNNIQQQRKNFEDHINQIEGAHQI